MHVHVRNCFILCLLKTISAKKVIAQFALFVQRDQHGITAKHLT